MIRAFEIIAERKIEEFLRKGEGPDLSHWKNKPLPVEDMSNVPTDLRMDTDSNYYAKVVERVPVRTG